MTQTHLGKVYGLVRASLDLVPSTTILFPLPRFWLEALFKDSSCIHSRTVGDSNDKK